MIKYRLRLILLFTLVLGFVFGKLTWWPFAFEALDWAAKGQTVSARMMDYFTHFAPGAIIGVIVGFLLGLFIPINWLKEDVTSSAPRELNGVYKIIITVINIGIMLIIGHYVKDGFLFMIITLPIVIIIFWIATHFFGVTDKEIN